MKKSLLLQEGSFSGYSLATGYLPGQSPAEYFRCCRVSLPCSGWVRVGPRRLVTKEVYPDNCIELHRKPSLFQGQTLDRLVLLGYTHYCAYTCSLSTRLSSGGLTLRRDGKSYLKVGFALRCFQRLSAPNTATQRWPLGGTTGTLAVGPSRSSRTKDGSSQISCAHTGYGPNCLTTF